MSLAKFLPLASALVLGLPVVLAAVSPRVERLLTRVAIVVFDRYEDSEELRRDRVATLRAAHYPVIYRHYAATSALVALVGGIVAGVFGMYVVWGIILVLSVDPAVAAEYLPAALQYVTFFLGYEPPPIGLELFVYHLVVALLFGVSGAVLVYGYRWYRPRMAADERARQIDLSMPMTVSFMYALSRSGMAFPEAMRILAANDEVYGHAADEVEVAVRNVDVFGMDVVTAVQTMSRRSPSTKFSEFSENLSSVLQTGGSLSEFLHRQYEDYRQEAETQQERILDQLDTIAQGYVTLGVVGPLFMITILVVIAVTIGDEFMFSVLQVMVYLALPLLNLAIIAYLTSVVDGLSVRDPTTNEVSVDLSIPGIRRRVDLLAEGRSDSGDDPPTPTGPAIGTATDGGTPVPDPGGESPDADGSPGLLPGPDLSLDDRDRANMERLAVYERLRELRHHLGNPVRTVARNPTSLLWATIPLAVLLVGIRLPSRLADGSLAVAEVDGLLVQSLLFLTGTFAVAYGARRRRVDAIEAVMPDFLDRLASLNEAGMNAVGSLDRVRETDLGPLDEELDVVWADVQWGADVETALKRFERRVPTPTVSRVVTLTTEAMKASGSLGPVLRIAANQAKADRRLKQRRRQKMVTYLVVVYLAFFVFLFIVGVLTEVLIPSLPDQDLLEAGTGGVETPEGTPAMNPVPALENFGQIDPGKFRTLLFHATVLQGLFSGFIAGQLSAGDLRAGAKHVTILVALGYLAFLVVL